MIQRKSMRSKGKYRNNLQEQEEAKAEPLSSGIKIVNDFVRGKYCVGRSDNDFYTLTF